MLEPWAECKAFLKGARAVAGNVKQIYWKLKPEPVKIPKNGSQEPEAGPLLREPEPVKEMYTYNGSQEPGAGLC